MGLRFLEHILILTHDPDGTRDRFVKNLGFRDGYHPEFGFPVYWLYIGEQKCAFRRVFCWLLHWFKLSTTTQRLARQS